MADEAFVQVAPDSTGKKVAMLSELDVYGNLIFKQKALLIDAPADALVQILDHQRLAVGLLRAILRVLSDTSNSRTTEEDFASTYGENFDG